MCEAHAVADHQDDIAYLGPSHRADRYGLVGGGQGDGLAARLLCRCSETDEEQCYKEVLRYDFHRSLVLEGGCSVVGLSASTVLQS